MWFYAITALNMLKNVSPSMCSLNSDGVSSIFYLCIAYLKYLWVCSLIMFRILLVAKNNKTMCTAEQHLFFSNRNMHTNAPMWFVSAKETKFDISNGQCTSLIVITKGIRKLVPNVFYVFYKKKWKSRQKRIFQQNFDLTAFGTLQRKNYYPNPFEPH